jgi:hypothetical protein
VIDGMVNGGNQDCESGQSKSGPQKGKGKEKEHGETSPVSQAD